MAGRRAVAALVLAGLALPAWAQIGPPPMSPDPSQGWTGQRIGNQEHWRNERGETWRMLPMGDRQQLWIDPAGQSQICVRTGPVTNCR